MPQQTNPSAPTADGSRPHYMAAWIALCVSALFYLFEFLTRVAPSVATDQIISWFKVSEGEFGALASMLFFIYAPMQLVVGVVLDRVGGRWPVIFGSLLCAVGVGLFALTDVFAIAGLGRAINGFGAAFAFVAALWFVGHWFPPKRFAFLSGLVNAIGMIGTAVGAVALSGLASEIGWRNLFFGLAGFGLLLSLLAYLTVREPPTKVQQETRLNTKSVEQAIRSVLARPRNWMLGLLNMLFYTPITVYGSLWGNKELQSVHGLNTVEAETLVSFIFWGMAVGSLAFGALSSRFHIRRPLILIGVVMAGLTFCALLYLATGNPLLVGATVFLTGFFTGAQMLTFAWARDGCTRADSALTMATVNMLGMTGAIVFQPLVGAIADATGGDLRLALTVVPVALGLALVLTLVIPDAKPTPTV